MFIQYLNNNSDHSYNLCCRPGKHFSLVLQMFDRKCLAKVKK